MQKHVIKRQIIELSVADQRTAQQLQADVSRIYRQRLVPLIDQICSEFSSPDQIRRIERLVIDLGDIDPQQFEKAFMERAQQALYQALAQEFNQPANGQPSPQDRPQTQSHLELLTFFLRTGSLPWWADVRQPNLLSDVLTALMAEVPDTLRPVLRELFQSEAYQRRLINSFDDEILARLAVVLAAQSTVLTAEDLTAFNILLTQTIRVPAQLVRQRFWLNVLHLASQTATSAPARFYEAILVQLAVQFGIAYATLLGELEQSIQKTPHPAALQQALHDLLAIEAATAPQLTAANFQRQLLAELEKLGHHTGQSQKDIMRQLINLVYTLLADQQALSPEILTKIRAIPDDPTHAEALELVYALLVDQQALSPAVLARIQAISESRELETLPQTTTPDLTFSEADEVYIHNAGLVILWPFLTRFFENLGLVTERQFKNEAAQHRAAGILQYLLHPAEIFPEYLLPLNKVLCGLELATVFDFGPTLTEAEIVQCQPFLEAVIAQAPILRNMSVDGLRGTFLLRQGSLSTRNGIWLLRVERETYDLVLDRFPWSWSWVKLPWMTTPLQVEW